MHEIFISYSSHDRENANALADSLRSADCEVWMDTVGIDGAMNWSSEIVTALNNCHTLLFLISAHSAASHNCAKEIQLASEKQKNILPVIIEDVQLPVIFEYPLAGLHRLQLLDTVGISRAIAKLREGRSALDAMMAMSAKDYAGYLRLAVLPFEDLSPSHDNEWFADGMTDELIGTLGSLSKLIVPGRSSVMVYKKDRPKASIIGEELEVRYIVEGAVRKIGEKIHINASLTDAKLNIQLWNNKFNGTFEDIFDFQERVAREITAGLKLKLTPQDEENIEAKITENTEAYELYVKAHSYFNHFTKQDYLYALDCLNEAVRLDPLFASAYVIICRIHINLFRSYEQNASHITAATEAIEKVRILNPDLPSVYNALSEIYLQNGEKDKAIESAHKAVDLDPKNYNSRFQLGYIYAISGQPEEAIRHYEEFLHLDPTDLVAHFNLCNNYVRIKDTKKRNVAAERALPYFERHLKKSPDDHNQKIRFAILLGHVGRKSESLQLADEIIHLSNADGQIIYNGACIFAEQGEHERSLTALAMAIEKGFTNYAIFSMDPDLDVLRGMPEFKELIKKLV